MSPLVYTLLLTAVVVTAVPHYDDYDSPKDRYFAPKPYEFGYDVKDEHGSTQNRHEDSDGHGRVRGSYGYTDPWGIYRHVDYVADEYGFRAKVKTNEPGTANQDPAAVEIYSNQPAYRSIPYDRPVRKYRPVDDEPEDH